MSKQTGKGCPVPRGPPGTHKPQSVGPGPRPASPAQHPMGLGHHSTSSEVLPRPEPPPDGWAELGSTGPQLPLSPAMEPPRTQDLREPVLPRPELQLAAPSGHPHTSQPVSHPPTVSLESPAPLVLQDTQKVDRIPRHPPSVTPLYLPKTRF